MQMQKKMLIAAFFFLHFFAQVLLAQNSADTNKNDQFCTAGSSCPSNQKNSASNSSADFLAEMLRATSFFGGGFALILLGSVVGLFYSLWSWILYFFRREALLSMEVSCREECYSWVLTWINKHAGPNARHVSLECGNQSQESIFFCRSDEDSKDPMDVRLKFVPAPGTHLIKYFGKLLYIERSREKEEKTNSWRNKGPFETVTISTWGRDMSYFKRIVEECQLFAKEERRIGVPIYMKISYDDSWERAGHPRRKRTLQSVVLQDGVQERLTNDVKDFLDTEDWYLDCGIPYRRGYLFYGPPGCGKSSTILALASELDFGICLVNLREVGDDSLVRLLANTPKRTFILFEDIDVAFKTRLKEKESKKSEEKSAEKDEKSEKEKEEKENEEKPKCTLSGLLNALDGVSTTDGRIIFMTTNHPETLDPALIRPGRIDMKQYFGYCTESQIKKLFARFYKNAKENAAEEFEQKVAEMELDLSAAELQGYLQIHKRNLDGAMRNFHLLRELSVKKLVNPSVSKDSSKNSAYKAARSFSCQQ